MKFWINLINSDEFDGLIRHGLTLVGGIIVATNSGNAEIVGWAIAALATIWSVASKTYIRKQAVLVQGAIDAKVST
jgi:hypothetical protein